MSPGNGANAGNQPGEMPPVLELDRVWLSFDDQPVLRDITLTVRRGDTWVILGAAGSGKTVLLKLIMRLLRQDQGVIRLFGDDVSHQGERELHRVRSRIGMLFQESALFDSLTIEENVAYPLENQPGSRAAPEEIAHRVKEALEFVELGHTLKRVPSELSGGMRRRVGIARATVTQPDLALYDSPTAGLDPITANNIMAFIAKQRDLRGTTSLIVSHRYQDGVLMANYEYDAETGTLVRPREADCPARRTRFLVMNAGSIVFAGSQRELEASADPYVSKFGRR
jgi:phospholipid/cholesterol/gamma-HCH transport system ATP-binding protein